MKRRNFVKASLLSGSIASIIPQAGIAHVNEHVQQKPNQEFYELRTYSLKNGRQQKLVEDYLQNAVMPALNKLGSKNVGVFTEYLPQSHTKLFVLIPYNSTEDFVNAAQNWQVMPVTNKPQPPI
jgi:hypothetical protein